MSQELLIWRDGAVHGVVAERRGRLSITYASDARPISVSLPVKAGAYDDRRARTWLRGLLPEGPTRAMITYDLQLAPDDDFGLLAALGKDCAGALSLRPDGAAHDENGVGPILTDGQVGALLRSLPTSPLGVDAGFRVSLPGNQSKLLLTRSARGWHRPDGAPSTHILKPAVRELADDTIDNEAYCQRLARQAGLPAATTTIEQFDGVRVLASERFDRIRTDTGLRRIHQEDGCQATCVDPTDKYQTATSGPTLRSIAVALATNGGRLAPLLQLVTFTVAVGNADLHGKNLSFVFDDDDGVTLAPVYDAMSTRLYDTTADGRHVNRTLGMHIANKTDIDDVTSADLAEEARSWGVSERAATRTIAETVAAIRAALDRVEPHVDALRSLIVARLDSL